MYKSSTSRFQPPHTHANNIQRHRGSTNLQMAQRRIQIAPWIAIPKHPRDRDTLEPCPRPHVKGAGKSKAHDFPESRRCIRLIIYLKHRAHQVLDDNTSALDDVEEHVVAQYDGEMQGARDVVGAGGVDGAGHEKGKHEQEIAFEQAGR